MSRDYNRFDNVLAAIASALVPGLGQAFESRWHLSMLFFLGALICYLIFIPLGMIIHIWAIFDAAFYRAGRKYADASEPEQELRV